MSATIDINGKKMLPIKEVILQVDYSRDYITRLAREQKIVATQIGRQWYVDLDSLHNYQAVVTAEQKIKKRQLSEERKRELAIKEQKERQRVEARQRTKKKKVAVMTMCFIVALGTGLGLVIESEVRKNFTAVDQLASLNDANTQGPLGADYTSAGSDALTPEFVPNVSYRDLTSDEGLLLVPMNASGTVATEAYFSDPVTVVEDEDGSRSVRRVNAAGEPTGAEVPFILVPINSNSP